MLSKTRLERLWKRSLRRSMRRLGAGTASLRADVDILKGHTAQAQLSPLSGDDERIKVAFDIVSNAIPPCPRVVCDRAPTVKIAPRSSSARHRTSRTVLISCGSWHFMA
jgi:hypothetical protein